MPKARELEVRLERTEQQLRLFQKISRFMVREMSLQEVLQGIVSLIVEFMECDSCLVYLLDQDELVLCASNTPHPSTIGKLRMTSNEGLTGWVARERRLLAAVCGLPPSAPARNLATSSRGRWVADRPIR